jgi:hypothetical protein
MPEPFRAGKWSVFRGGYPEPPLMEMSVNILRITGQNPVKSLDKFGTEKVY